MKWAIAIVATLILTRCTDRPLTFWTFEAAYPIVAATMLGDIKRLAVMTKESVSILDAETGKEVSRIRGFESDVHEITCTSAICWIGGGEHLVGRLYTVDIMRREIKRIETSEGIAAINAIALSADNKILITGHDDETMISWDTDTMQPKKRIVAQSGGEILAMHFVGNTLAAGNSAGELMLWDGQSESFIKRVNLANGTIISIAPIGDSLSVSGWEYMDILDPKHPTEGRLIKIDNATVVPCDVDEGNKTLWCRLTGGSLKRGNIKELNRSTLRLHNDDIRFVKVFGDLVITASKDKTVKAWKQSHIALRNHSLDGNPGR